jgi:hypothetical protein
MSVDGPDPRFAGKQLPISRFAGDSGAADPELRAVLADHAAGGADLYAVQNALLDARVLIPTAAVLDEAESDVNTGLTAEKSSHLSVVSFVSNAGWHGLLAFTGMDAVRAWDPQARPVPVTASEAAAAAQEEGRSVLVLDIAGPTRVALTGPLLRALAAARRAVPVHQDAEVAHAVLECALAVDGVTGVKLESPEAAPGADALVVLRVVDAADTSSVVAQVSAHLGAHPLLLDRCGQGLALTVGR